MQATSAYQHPPTVTCCGALNNGLLIAEGGVTCRAAHWIPESLGTKSEGGTEGRLAAGSTEFRRGHTVQEVMRLLVLKIKPLGANPQGWRATWWLEAGP